LRLDGGIVPEWSGIRRHRGLR